MNKTKAETTAETRQRAQTLLATQSDYSPLPQSKNGQRAPESDATQSGYSPAPAFSAAPYPQLKALWASRVVVQKDIQVGENRRKALIRQGQTSFAQVLGEAHDLKTLCAWKKNIEDEMELIVQELPAWTQFFADTRGVRPLGAALMLACIGDPAQYRNPSTIWKRMGLAVIEAENTKKEVVISRQRRFKDKNLAAAHGYFAERHAVAWNVAKTLCQWNPEYRALAVERQTFKETQDWGVPCDQSREPHGPDTTEHRSRCRGCSHRWKDARRYASKRLFREMWVVLAK